MIHFSALAFLGTHKFDEFVKLMLFNLIIMAGPIERRSIRLRKPKIHFDDQITESLKFSKPFKAPKAPTKPTESAAQPTIPSLRCNDTFLAPWHFWAPRISPKHHI